MSNLRPCSHKSNPILEMDTSHKSNPILEMDTSMPVYTSLYTNPNFNLIWISDQIQCIMHVTGRCSEFHKEVLGRILPHFSAYFRPGFIQN